MKNIKQKNDLKSLLLKLPADLADQAKVLAKSKGMTLQNWIRSLLRAEAFNT